MGEGVGFDQVDDVVEGVVVGEFEQAAFRVAASEANASALVLVERTAFGPHGFYIWGSAEQTLGGHT